MSRENFFSINLEPESKAEKQPPIVSSEPPQLSKMKEVIREIEEKTGVTCKYNEEELRREIERGATIVPLSSEELKELNDAENRLSYLRSRLFDFRISIPKDTSPNEE